MLYRRQRNTQPFVVALALLVGLVAGLLAGRASAPAPTLDQLLAPAQAHLRQASGALEIVPLEYARAIHGSASSRQATLQAAQQAAHELEAAPLLAQLYPAPYHAAQRALADLHRAMTDRQGVPAVQTAVTLAQQRLRALTIPPGL